MRARRRVRKFKDRKIFRRTARRMASANLSDGVFRGGIRL